MYKPMEYEYDTILNLADANQFKKLMIVRNSWGKGNWCIVNKVVFKPDKKTGYAYGHIHYSDGSKSNGSIPCASTYAWRVVKVLEEDMQVEYMDA